MLESKWLQNTEQHQWNQEIGYGNTSKILKQNYFQPRLVYPAKLPFKYKNMNILDYSKNQNFTPIQSLKKLLNNYIVSRKKKSEPIKKV